MKFEKCLPDETENRESVEEAYEKKAYKKPKIEEHKPLEESTAYVYYYYTW